MLSLFFVCKQKTAYDMRISDWSSDVCSSDLPGIDRRALKQCLGEAQPQAFIGIALAQWARRLLGWGRGHVRQCVSVGRFGFAGPRLATLERDRKSVV